MSNNLKIQGDEWHTSTEEQHAAGLDAQPPAHKPPQTHPLRIRQISLYGLILVVFLLFFARLWDLQVARGAYYRDKATFNVARPVRDPAPRGMVYDRTGTPLVRNVPNFTVKIVPAYLPDNELDEMEVYRKLSLLLDMPITTQVASAKPMGNSAGPLGIKDIVDKARNEGQNFRSITIKSGVPRDVAMTISEQKTIKLQGVEVDVTGTRQYPLGSLVSQIVGYVGPIPQESVQDYISQDYDPDVDRVGLTGIENTVESFLRGTKGSRYVEEDVAGREVRIIGQPNPPVPGDNVYLSIDGGLQKAATDALQAELDEINRFQGREVTRRGAVIAMNPQNGQILALVSLPTYDNNLFTRNRISQDDLDKLMNDDHRPLLNHAIYDHIAPGSIFKLIPASAALQEKVITPKTIINDPGTIVIPNKYFPDDPRQATKLTCWLKTGHGAVDLLHGLAYSCDVYFWEVGAGYNVPNQPKFEGLGIDRLVKYSQMFGLGQLTGIDIPGEVTGHVPTQKWKRLTYGETWTDGDTYNYAIGQGYLEVTPLQMLNVAAAVANGGTLYKPQVVDHITDANGNVVRAFKPQPNGHVDVSLENLQLVQQGMEASVMWGTSTKAQVPGIRVAGKTGTAEFCDDLAYKQGFCYPGHIPTHAWFISFAPVGNPQIALVVYIYNGGEGSEHAVPVAKKILDYYFGQLPKPKS